MLEARVVKGVCRMTGERRGDLKKTERWESTWSSFCSARWISDTLSNCGFDFVSVPWQWLSSPTCVIFSCGMVSKLGEENVNPLSVPASYGKRTSETFSFHWLPSQRLMLSTPTNQSGLGTILTINDSWSQTGGSRALRGRWSMAKENKRRGVRK